MSFSKLKGVRDIGEFGPSENLSENLIRFFDWGFVNAGGFNNVNIPSSSIYGGDKHILHFKDEPNFTDGQVWEAGRGNWVWESGVGVDDEPIGISGVYVNGTFHSRAASGAFAHHYDYDNGRVVFDTAIDIDSDVQLEYSYKFISVVDAYTVPFFQKIQQNGFTFLNNAASGDLISGSKTLQMPIVAIEVPPIQDTAGYEIGSGGRYVYHTILCHVITDNPQMNRRIGDIIADQGDKTILLYNLNDVIASGDYPLDSDGMVIDGAMSYPELALTYAWKKLRILDAKNNTQITQLNRGTYLSTARLTTQLILNVV